MKMRLVATLIGLAIGLALRGIAQEPKPVDPEVRQQIEAVDMKLGEAFKKHDAAAVAALFTQDAVQVLDWSGGGTFLGREAIEKSLAVNFASSPPETVGKLVQMYAIGDEISATSEWSCRAMEGLQRKDLCS